MGGYPSITQILLGKNNSAKWGRRVGYPFGGRNTPNNHCVLERDTPSEGSDRHPMWGDGYISGKCTLNCVRDSAIELVHHRFSLIQSINTLCCLCDKSNLCYESLPSFLSYEATTASAQEIKNPLGTLHSTSNTLTGRKLTSSGPCPRSR